MIAMKLLMLIKTIFTGCLTIINTQVSALVGKDNEVVIQKLYLVLECTIHVFLLTSPLHSELCCVIEGLSLFSRRFTG